MWQFPNCIEAADGKHITIIHPSSSGSEFYNYEGFFSIVLLAIVDYDYKFIFADVGCQRRISDSEVYRNGFFIKLRKRIYQNFRQINLCQFLTIRTTTAKILSQWHAFLTDVAFPLGKHCLKPYSESYLTPIKRIFNYRLSKVRRVTENAFGILTNRFRVFTTRMCSDPDKATMITLATLVLHNMLCQLSYKSYTAKGYIDMETESGDIVEGNGEFYNVCQRVIHEKLLGMSNISEMYLLIILRTWPDSLAMENDLKTLENTIFCVAIPSFFIML